MPPTDVKTIDELSTVLNSSPLVVLDFHAPWCGPCKVAMPHYASLATKYPNVQFLKLDLNQADKRIASLFSVRSIPLFVVIHNNQEVQRHEGYEAGVTLEAIASTLTRLSK